MSTTITAPAAAPQQGARKRAAWRPAAAAAATGAVLVISGFGVFAALNAEATGVQALQSGTLNLTLAPASGSTGFAQAIANMAPGDTVNRYVTLTNSGTLAGRALTLKVAATGSNVLVTDTASSKGLRVSVVNCTQAWSAAGACAASGGGTTVVDDVALSALATPNAFTGITTALPGAVMNLKVSVVLPDQVENSVNGVVSGNSVQNRSVSLTYTFAETQRAATTT